MRKFHKWLDTLISEKGIDLESHLEVTGPTGTLNLIPVGSLLTMIKSAPRGEQDAIQRMLVRIDFVNGDVRDYLKHLAQAIAL